MNRSIVGLLLITAILGCTTSVAPEVSGGGGAADGGAVPFCEFVNPSLGPTCAQLPNAIVTRCYDGGPCETIGCIPNFADCNGQTSDGCEVDIQHDRENCGACNVVCAAGFCVNGVCL